MIGSANFPETSQIIAVAIGGAIGCIARFLAVHYFAAFFGTTFPWATLFVNIAGSIWLGFVAALALSKPGTMDPVVRLLLTTGFAGGFTTFSTFTYESLSLYERGDSILAMANIGANVIIALFGTWIGASLARLL